MCLYWTPFSAGDGSGKTDFFLLSKENDDMDGVIGATLPTPGYKEKFYASASSTLRMTVFDVVDV